MKICILSDPIYVHTQRWASFFSGRGHQVSIVTDRDPNETPIQAQVYRLPHDRYPGPWILRTTLALRRLLKEIDPDIVHMHYLSHLVAPVLLRFHPFVASVWGADVVGTTGLAQESRKHRFLKRTILRNADAVIALSEFLARATRQYAGLPENRVVTHYWGVDLNQFPPANRARNDNGEFVLGFVKHLLPKYGPEYLIRAMPMICSRHPKVKLQMIGDGNLKESLQGLAAELGVAHAVTFCGSIPHSEVPKRMAGMDIFVMPSVYESETLGVAALEAEAMGIPVVASRIGGIPEAVADGVTGLLVPPRDPAAIAAAVNRIIADKALREAMSQGGRRYVAQHFDWSQNGAAIEDLYRELIRKHPR